MRFLKRLFFTLFFSLLIAGGIFYLAVAPESPKDFIAYILEELNFDSKKVESDSSVLVSDSLELIPPIIQKVKPAYKLLPLPVNPFAKIDKYARNTPKEAEESIETLAEHLGKVASTDLEKARVIYVWLTKNISYDDDGYNSGNCGDTSAEGLLNTRKSVCDGFSSLYLTLGSVMGLEIKKVVGYAKGYSYSIGSKFRESNHAWNIIKINNEWRVFDATWGEGYGENIDGKLVSTKTFNNYWFNVSPYEAIFSHYPEDPTLTYVSPSIDLATYEKLPYVVSSYFELGFSGQTTYDASLRNSNGRFPDAYAYDTHIKILKAPALRELEVGKPYDFEVYIPRGYDVVTIDAVDEWKYFERENGIFRAVYYPTTSGSVKVSVKHEKSNNMYETILKYDVVSKSSLY